MLARCVQLYIGMRQQVRWDMRDFNMYRRIIANAEQLDVLQLNNRTWTETKYTSTLERAAFFDEDISNKELEEENSYIRGYN